MRELTLEEMEQVAGGLGPAGAVIGGVSGIIGGATLGAVGGFFGGIASATTGLGRAMFGGYAVGASVLGSATGEPSS